jgi:predicted Zn-dependent protease
MMLFAGRLYAASGDVEPAERLLHAAVLKEAPNTAAAALLELGRMFIAQGRPADAAQVLERMILEYPASALVPQGRRLLDQAKGAVPRT